MDKYQESDKSSIENFLIFGTSIISSTYYY